MTEYQRNIVGSLGQLDRENAPLALAINGRAKPVVESAASYQELLECLHSAETDAAIRQA